MAEKVSERMGTTSSLSVQLLPFTQGHVSFFTAELCIFTLCL